MSKQVSENQKAVSQIEEAVKKYNEVVKNAENEIGKIKQQLLDAGVSGTIVTKLKPVWHNDVAFLLRQEIKKAG